MDPEQKGSAPGAGGEGGGTGDGQQPAGGAAPVTEFEIDGQKYSADQIREWKKAHGDYGQLMPEFTRKSQLLSEAEKQGLFKEGKWVKPEAPNPNLQTPQAQEAVKILKELGFMTKEEAAALQKTIEELKGNFETTSASQQLNQAVNYLTGKYSGKNGAPAFKLEEIQAAAQKDPNALVYTADGQVDLEQTYLKMHADFYLNVQNRQPKVVKTERGVQVQTTSTQKKKAESEEERQAAAVDFFRKAKEASTEE